MVTNNTYFLWLEDLVRQGASSGRSYGRLTYILFMTEFTWSVPNDGNRLEDGKSLRDVFTEENGKVLRLELDNYPCSVLEVLISLARRMEDNLYESSKGDRTVQWLWMLIRNLELHTFTDGAYEANPKAFDSAVRDILQTFIDRTYDRKGKGGLFPLKSTKKDQRRVEIWYQMMEFLDENL